MKSSSSNRRTTERERKYFLKEYIYIYEIMNFFSKERIILHLIPVYINNLLLTDDEFCENKNKMKRKIL